MRTWIIGALALVGFMGGPALAAEPAGGQTGEQEVRVFNFEGDTISTDYLKPGGTMIEGLRRGRRSSLIEVRLDFVAEILRSAEDI
ncbi:MAG: hypothetical protein EP329_14385 [Deltaproteobacteria bacterium]|nr:MAG: hypothetical protein EP329_14385 [Deltaproteobacteria bacterium]